MNRMFLPGACSLANPYATNAEENVIKIQAGMTIIRELRMNLPIGSPELKTRMKFSQCHSPGRKVNFIALVVASELKAMDTTKTSGAQRIAETTVRMA